jgi:predicted nucleic acid-binding protein
LEEATRNFIASRSDLYSWVSEHVKSDYMFPEELIDEFKDKVMSHRLELNTADFRQLKQEAVKPVYDYIIQDIRRILNTEDRRDTEPNSNFRQRAYQHKKQRDYQDIDFVFQNKQPTFIFSNGKLIRDNANST